MIHSARAAATRDAARAILLLTVVACVPFTARTQEKADVLLVERPSFLVLFNQYQQDAREADLNPVVPFVPIRIIDRDATLGDGFTPCVKASIGGGTFYILKDNEGNLSASGNAGFMKEYASSLLLHDTIEVLSGGSLQLLSPTHSRSAPIAGGAQFVRLFRHGGLTYVQPLNDNLRFGWIDLKPAGEGKSWSLARDTKSRPQGIPERVVGKVNEKVQSLNAALSELFAFFGEREHKSIPPPHWRLETGPTSLICILESPTPVDRFAESTRLLGKDIQSIVLGTGLRVITQPGRIEVR